jgi:hypothetical protein
VKDVVVRNGAATLTVSDDTAGGFVVVVSGTIKCGFNRGGDTTHFPKDSSYDPSVGDKGILGLKKTRRP